MFIFRIRLFTAVALSLFLCLCVACGSTKVTRTGSGSIAGEPIRPRKASCDFVMFTTLPEGFAEIGVIDVNPGAYGHNVHRDIEDFKEEIREEVCAVGGDAAVAAANGLGMWIKATVLKRVHEPVQAGTVQVGRQSSTADAPEHGVFAMQQSASRRIEALRRRGGEVELRVRELNEKMRLRNCKRVVVDEGGTRQGFGTYGYSVKAHERKMFETMRIRMDAYWIDRVGRSQAAKLDLCGDTVELEAEFKSKLTNSPAAAAEAAPTLRVEVPVASQTVQGVKMLIVGTIDPSGDHIQLGLALPHGGKSVGECSVALVADGERLPLGEVTHVDKGGHDQYQTEIALEDVERLASAGRAVGRVCAARLQLEAPAQARVQEFVVRMKEERALMGSGEPQPAPRPGLQQL